MKQLGLLTGLFLIAVLLVSCATPYGKYGTLGGYRDNQIDANTFSIGVDNNAFTDQQTTSMHAMYRAAELTVENGYDYFVIVGGGEAPSSISMVIPSASSYGPATVVPMRLPNSTLLIKTFKGTKPEQANAYGAREVMKHLGPQIGISEDKGG